MNNTLSGINDLLQKANDLKKSMESTFLQCEKDIEKINDPVMKEFLKNSLLLAKENKLNATDFLHNLNKQCQQK